MGFDHFGLDFNYPDLVQYVDSFGASGHRAQNYDNFIDILSSSLNSKGVHVIDLPVDYSLNHSILNVLLKESACIV